VQLIHLTDPHLTGLDGWTPGLTAGKRWLSWLSWQRKRRHVHLRNRLDALVAALGTPEPEAWAITGDLCQIGLDREIDEARDWLAGLAPAERVLLVPGNHDIFAAGSEARLRRDWKDWLHLDGQDCDWPVERVFGDVVLIGVNSSIVTPPTRATGGLGEAQQQRLRETLRRHAGRCRVVLIHHPPLPGSCKPRKALLDAAVLTELLQAEGPALVLHGHLHHNRRRDLPGGSTAPPRHRPEARGARPAPGDSRSSGKATASIRSKWNCWGWTLRTASTCWNRSSGSARAESLDESRARITAR
jgi:3',5'-cyclic AMP phosphodiesterase CpdA